VDVSVNKDIVYFLA